MVELNAAKRQQWILLSNGLAQLAVVVVVIIKPWDWHNEFMTLAPIGRDFINFWAGGHLALAGKTDILVDLIGYNHLLIEAFQRRPDEWFIFSYPPHALLFLVPFGAIHHLPSVLVWTALNLFCIERTVRLLSAERSLALLACLSPAVLMMVAFGHFSGALAYATTYILVRGHERPAIGGVLLALMTVKPQLAAVFGLFLLFTGYWRVVLFSVPATLVLLAASVLAFGIKPWVNFLEWTVPLHNKLIADFYYGSLLVVVSVYIGARLIGLPGWAANGVQAAFSLVVLTQAIRLFNRRGADACAIAIAVFAVIAALPYFNCYDLAIFAPAMTVALFGRGRGENVPFLPLVPALLLWLAPMYAIPFGILGWPIVHPVIAGVLLYLLYRHGRTEADRAAGGRGRPAHPPQPASAA